MIIFDLDGTLADCSHRQHFINPLKDHPDYFRHPCSTCNDGSHHKIDPQYHKIYGWEWKPDWSSFFDACDKDTPIYPVIEQWNIQISLGMMDQHVIWSGRCESVREKTENWLATHLLCFNPKKLKMRPLGDYTPDDELKERWLLESCKYDIDNRPPGIKLKHDIDYVFDDRPKVVRMWKRYGIFVFNCQQNDEEF